MSLNANRLKLFPLICSIFCVCCAMKCNSPGPETTVHGVVTDGITGKPIGNLQMTVASLYDLEQGTSNNTSTFVTNADGSFNIKFKPQTFLSYSLQPAKGVINKYVYVTFAKVTQGIDNNIAYVLYPSVNVTVHLINHSTHNQLNFDLDINDSLGTHIGSSGGISLYKNLVTDTVFKPEIVHFTTCTFTGQFFTEANIIPTASQKFHFTDKDTTIIIDNP